MRWFALVLMLCGAVPGWANGKATALAKDAERFYKDARYREAADALKRAYALDANPKFLYNLARALDQAGDVKASLDAYRQYVALPSEESDPDLVKKANLAMDRLRTLLARQEADAKIREAEKRRMEEDARRLEDDARQARARAERETLAAKQQRELYEAKERLARDVTQKRTETRKLAAYLTGGAAVVGLGLGITFGLLATDARGRFTRATTLADKLSLESSTRAYAAVADVSFLVALGTAITAVVVFPKGDVTVAAAPMPGGGGLVSLEGRF